LFSRNDTQTFFSFVDKAHPLYAEIDRFRGLAAASAEFAELRSMAGSDRCEVPVFRQADDADPAAEIRSMTQGEETYLRGFLHRRSRPVDRGLLAAFRVCAEIHHLALMLKKDGYHAPTFRAVVGMVQELGRSLPTLPGVAAA
jgi:hypothetical protein